MVWEIGIRDYGKDDGREIGIRDYGKDDGSCQRWAAANNP